MTGNNSELDLAGLGKVAEAIPKEGWKKAIDTACETFTDLIAPVTSTTVGLGGLIQAKFDAMIDVQKVFAADAVYRARLKIESQVSPSTSRPSARVLVSAIEEASMESDDSLRDIWANLIANEISGSGVHPEFPRILARLSSQDATVLAEIAEDSRNERIRVAARALSDAVSFLIPGGSLMRDIAVFSKADMDKVADANREHLERLALIAQQDNGWVLTQFGAQFVASVTSPESHVKSKTD